MSNLMKIGELAKVTGLSIRTLHYYDEIGLLSPSDRTEVGHRLYSNQDIIRLQQIMSLRQLGFSLAEIQACLENPEFSLPKVIDLHRARVREQMSLSRTLLKRLNAIAQELQTTQTVAVENLIEAMETISMSKQYFTPQQQQVLETRFQEVEEEWQDLLNQARVKMSQGKDLNHPAVQWLARRWQAMMKFLIRGDEEIYEALAKMYQQEGAEENRWGTMDADTLEYMLKAVAFGSLGADLQIQISEQKYTPDAIEVIRLGKEIMYHQLNLDVFGTEGMLLGLLAERQSVAAQVLTAAGVTFETAKDQIGEVLGLHPKPLASVPECLPFAPRAQRVLELARQQAQPVQVRIAPEHLLLGILQETEEVESEQQPVGVAAYVLKKGFGIDFIHLEQQLKLTMDQSY
jgi:DNA-binding transcriptional MerR regulator